MVANILLTKTIIILDIKYIISCIVNNFKYINTYFPDRNLFFYLRLRTQPNLDISAYFKLYIIFPQSLFLTLVYIRTDFRKNSYFLVKVNEKSTGVTFIKPTPTGKMYFTKLNYFATFRS